MNWRFRRDDLFGVLFIASAILAFASSFALFTSDGQPLLFLVSVTIALVSLRCAESRAGMIGGLALFLIIRVIWAAFLYITNAK